MRPEITNNNFGKSPYAYFEFNANNNFKHFKYCYHDADDIYKFYAIFMKMLTFNMVGSIWSPWRNERSATATTMEMVPQQYFDDPTTH